MSTAETALATSELCPKDVTIDIIGRFWKALKNLSDFLLGAFNEVKDDSRKLLSNRLCCSQPNSEV